MQFGSQKQENYMKTNEYSTVILLIREYYSSTSQIKNINQDNC